MALRPVTLIQKGVVLEPDKVDCVFYSRASRPLWLYIYLDETQKHLRFYCQGNLYQGGECEYFISHVNRLWEQHGGANNSRIHVSERGFINTGPDWGVWKEPASTSEIEENDEKE